MADHYGRIGMVASLLARRPAEAHVEIDLRRGSTELLPSFFEGVPIRRRRVNDTETITIRINGGARDIRPEEVRRAEDLWNAHLTTCEVCRAGAPCETGLRIFNAAPVG